MIDEKMTKKEMSAFIDEVADQFLGYASFRRRHVKRGILVLSRKSFLSCVTRNANELHGRLMHRARLIAGVPSKFKKSRVS